MGTKSDDVETGTQLVPTKVVFLVFCCFMSYS